MVVFNETDINIFISRKWKEDPDGGPAIQEETICIGPGMGIELSIIGLHVRATSPDAKHNSTSHEDCEKP